MIILAEEVAAVLEARHYSAIRQLHRRRLTPAELIAQIRHFLRAVLNHFAALRQHRIDAARLSVAVIHRHDERRVMHIEDGRQPPHELLPCLELVRRVFHFVLQRRSGRPFHRHFQLSAMRRDGIDAHPADLVQ